MSRPANPYDNATCESFLKTLKREEILVCGQTTKVTGGTANHRPHSPLSRDPADEQTVLERV
jgi:transposase InsO family protein